jgi:hypothetical protein
VNENAHNFRIQIFSNSPCLNQKSRRSNTNLCVLNATQNQSKKYLENYFLVSQFFFEIFWALRSSGQGTFTIFQKPV